MRRRGGPSGRWWLGLAACAVFGLVTSVVLAWALATPLARRVALWRAETVKEVDCEPGGRGSWTVGRSWSLISTSLDLSFHGSYDETNVAGQDLALRRREGLPG